LKVEAPKLGAFFISAIETGSNAPVYLRQSTLSGVANNAFDALATRSLEENAGRTKLRVHPDDWRAPDNSTIILRISP